MELPETWAWDDYDMVYPSREVMTTRRALILADQIDSLADEAWEELEVV